MNAIITSRVMNQDLYDQSIPLLTLPYEKKVYRPRTADANGYLWQILNLDCDWVVNVDEDLFVLDNNRLQGLMDHMEKNKYDFCGLPDGGCYHTRKHNPVAMNTFFNIFNVSSIKEKLANVSRKSLFQHYYSDTLGYFAPKNFFKVDVNGKKPDYCYDNFEEYYGLFFWLLYEGFTPLYLDGEDLNEEWHPKKIDRDTTIVKDHEGIPIAYHTWYGRKWKTTHRARIQKVIEKAKERVVS